MSLSLTWYPAGGYTYANKIQITPQWYEAYPDNPAILKVEAFIGRWVGFKVFGFDGQVIYQSGEHGSKRWYSNSYAARVGAERMLARLGLIKET